MSLRRVAQVVQVAFGALAVSSVATGGFFIATSVGLVDKLLSGAAFITMALGIVVLIFKVRSDLRELERRHGKEAVDG